MGLPVRCVGCASVRHRIDVLTRRSQSGDRHKVGVRRSTSRGAPAVYDIELFFVGILGGGTRSVLDIRSAAVPSRNDPLVISRYLTRYQLNPVADQRAIEPLISPAPGRELSHTVSKSMC